MCTYITENLPAAGSGKGPNGWFTLTNAIVYFDHPYHAPYAHALSKDFLNPGAGPTARVAVELDPQSARYLADAISRALDSAPPELLE